jgi:tetratricopeptide (TPR) repeat protein
LSEDVSRSRSIEATVLAVRGAFEAIEGSVEEARRHVGLAIQIAEALGTRVMVAVYQTFLGDVEMAAGDATAAERAYRRQYKILEETGHEGFKSTAAATLAGVLCTLGRFDEADGYAAIARNVAAENDLASQVFGRSAQALVHASRGELEDAEVLAREAVQMVEEAEWPGAQGDVRMDLARVLRMAGKSIDAERAAREALEFYDRKHNRPSAASTRAFLAEFGHA